MSVKRLIDLIYKSGHPFTANWGTDIHHNRNKVAEAKINAKHGGKTKVIKRGQVKAYLKMSGVCDVLYEDQKFIAYFWAPKVYRILANTNQSDDSIVFVIGITTEEMVEVLEPYGLIIKSDESSDLDKHGYVTFLQMDLGWVLRNQPLGEKGRMKPIFIGNLVSRYPKMAHSERDMSKDDSVSGMESVFEITSDRNVNSVLSKLSSGGPASIDIWILPVLRIVKDTVSGAKILGAIKDIDPNAWYEHYRDDVAFGLNPSFLGQIDVRELFVDDAFRKRTATV